MLGAGKKQSDLVNETSFINWLLFSKIVVLICNRKRTQGEKELILNFFL
jgi:hypothetical protein